MRKNVQTLLLAFWTNISSGWSWCDCSCKSGNDYNDNNMQMMWEKDAIIVPGVEHISKTMATALSNINYSPWLLHCDSPYAAVSLKCPTKKKYYPSNWNLTTANINYALWVPRYTSALCHCNSPYASVSLECTAKRITF